MRDEDYLAMDGVGLGELVSAGEVTPVELIDAALRRIAAHEARVGALAGLHEDDARAAAGGSLGAGPLSGVPMVLADHGASVRGWPVGSSNRATRGVAAPADATLVARWRRAGLVFLGRGTSSEFGALGEAAPRLVRNPWNADFVAGLGCSGPAAAVACGYVPIAHGTDGGGALRLSASACGLFGLKPSRGRVPLGPERPERWAGLATAHVLTRSVRDSAAALDAAAGPPSDASAEPPRPALGFRTALESPVGRLRIAVCTESLLGRSAPASARAAVEDAAKLLGDLGHEMVDAIVPIERERYRVAYLQAVAVAVAVDVEAAERALGRTAHADEFDPFVWFLALAGSTFSAVQVERARDTFHFAARKMAAFHESYDALLTPTGWPPRVVDADFGTYQRWAMSLARVAPSRQVLSRMFDELCATGLDRLGEAPLFNLTGQPAMSVPTWMGPDGVPVGVQISGRYGEDALLLRLARQIEIARPFVALRAPMVSAAIRSTPPPP